MHAVCWHVCKGRFTALPIRLSFDKKRIFEIGCYRLRKLRNEPVMSLIRLTPTAHLIWELDTVVRDLAENVDVSSDGFPDTLAVVRNAFRNDWRDGLFRLAAEKVSLDGLPSEHAGILRFWKEFASGYLTALSHIPESATALDVPPPDDAWLGRFILAVPPMTGGEYVSQELLRQLWDRLVQWGREQIGSVDQLPRFMKQRASAWNPVGRVCFHLAENKADTGAPLRLWRRMHRDLPLTAS
ncbi:hypothetical protein JXA80_07780 [bacterium]|nr:hypothetical protein [candidate division CSSED10-310 bacterium]